MIASFKDDDAKELFEHRVPSKRLAGYAKAALRKLDQLDVIDQIDELFIPPGNKLKKLTATTWQIRIDEKHRIRFRWDGRNAQDVEIGDFH